MIRGFRWVLTGYKVWQLEGPPKSRRFHGCVSVISDAEDTRWHTDHKTQGECKTKREAMDCVENQLRVEAASHGVCEVCLESFEPGDLEDGVTVLASCCERAGLCRHCAKKGRHDCDEPNG